MKAALLTTVLVFASSTSAMYVFKGITSDKMVNVGRLDVFDVVHPQFNSSAEDFGIISDKGYVTTSKICTTPDLKFAHELSVNVRIEGRWGDKGDLGHLDMRDAMFQAMWAFIQQTIDLTKYEMYADCPVDPPPRRQPGPGRGGGNIIRRARTEEETCGPKSPNGYCPCTDYNSDRAVRCYGKAIGKKLPSIFSIAVFDGYGKLMPDQLTVTFTTSMPGEYQWGGCGVYGGIGKVTVSFIPKYGTYFEKVFTADCNM